MPPVSSGRSVRPAAVTRMLGSLFIAVALAGCAPGVAAARTGPNSFAPMVRQILPAVVNIAVTESVATTDPLAGLPSELQKQFRDRFHSRKQEMMGAGSGFIIDPSGYIVTNNHVVGNADKIVVALSNGTEYPATVVGTDELTDIAVIKVNAPGPLTAVPWGDSGSVEVGDWIVAAGNPFGLGGSVTAGIVSARGRDINAGPFDDFIQLDAPINPGNSGGPVFNMDGEVVAVTTAIVSPTGGSVGIGFAIPSELVRRIVAELREKGRIERGWLGVSVQEQAESGGVARPRGSGVVIASVDRSGPAARAGVRPGDLLMSVNGDRVDTARSVIKAVASVPPGNSVHILLRRQGHDMDLSVTVGRRPNTQG